MCGCVDVWMCGSSFRAWLTLRFQTVNEFPLAQIDLQVLFLVARCGGEPAFITMKLHVVRFVPGGAGGGGEPVLGEGFDDDVA